MILKAYFLSQVPDIIFVPVSINYDRILEEKPFAFELLGVPKSPESTSVSLPLHLIRSAVKITFIPGFFQSALDR